jgi:hypothetical protein
MRKSTPPIAIRIILTPNAELPVREQYPVRTPRARTLRNGRVMSFGTDSSTFGHIRFRSRCRYTFGHHTRE